MEFRHLNARSWPKAILGYKNAVSLLNPFSQKEFSKALLCVVLVRKAMRRRMSEGHPTSDWLFARLATLFRLTFNKDFQTFIAQSIKIHDKLTRRTGIGGISIGRSQLNGSGLGRMDALVRVWVASERSSKEESTRRLLFRSPRNSLFYIFNAI